MLRLRAVNNITSKMTQLSSAVMALPSLLHPVGSVNDRAMSGCHNSMVAIKAVDTEDTFQWPLPFSCVISVHAEVCSTVNLAKLCQQ